jgi:hypothetical protein
LTVQVRVRDDTQDPDGTPIEPHIMGREIFMELSDGARVNDRGHGGRVVYDVTISYIMIMGGGRVGERAQGESLGTRVFKN